MTQSKGIGRGRYNARKLRKHHTPAKGTFRRALLLFALRPQGVTVEELQRKKGGSRARVSAEINRLLDDYGYDIRSFSGDPRSVPGPRPRRYILVGRYTDTKRRYWDFTRFRKLS